MRSHREWGGREPGLLSPLKWPLIWPRLGPRKRHNFGNRTKQQTTLPTVALGFCVFFQRLALFPAVTYEDPPFSTGSHYLTCQVRNRFQGWKATQRSANFKPWSCQWSAKFWVPPEALLHLGSNRWCLASLGKEALGALLEEQAKGQPRQKEGPHWLVPVSSSHSHWPPWSSPGRE